MACDRNTGLPLAHHTAVQSSLSLHKGHMKIQNPTRAGKKILTLKAIFLTKTYFI
jgi:hypothetical protein